ncbi:MAG: Uma2 family endonuclease [Deltaproteobacteria bacterium]|nr:Uma2 family endonuclease [Deltaproteobacteria bacterium]
MQMPEKEMPELIDGRPYVRATHRLRHGYCMTRLGGALDQGYNGASSAWWILAEPDVRLTPHRIVRPDLAGWRKDRMPDLTDNWPIDLRPDWACEIASPTNSHYDRGVKSKVYREAGIPWYWLVDPQERTVEVLELVGDTWRYHGGYTDGDALALPPFDEVVLTMGELFGPLPKGWPGT